jgi:hypothetical protein
MRISTDPCALFELPQIRDLVIVYSFEKAVKSPFFPLFQRGKSEILHPGINGRNEYLVIQQISPDFQHLVIAENIIFSGVKRLSGGFGNL